jgi:dihydroneopterin aldolase
MHTVSYISLEQLHVFARHGVYEEERIKGNDFVVDLRLKVDIGRAMQSDDIADTVNYAEVCAVVKREMEIVKINDNPVADLISEYLKSL